MVLQVLYWILLILTFGRFWLPEPYVKHAYFVEGILFIIIGLKLFGMPS